MRFIILPLLSVIFLQAQVKRDNDTVFDTKTNLYWQDDRSAKSVMKKFKDAIVYCEDLTLSGYDDWRLPSIKELQSITDSKEQNPTIIKGFDNCASNYYWSSTEHMDIPKRAWFISFDNGYKYSYHQNRSYYVRCVRD